MQYFIKKKKGCELEKHEICSSLIQGEAWLGNKKNMKCIVEDLSKSFRLPKLKDPSFVSHNIQYLE